MDRKYNIRMGRYTTLWCVYQDKTDVTFVFEGTITECESYIRLKEKGYITDQDQE